MKTTKHIPFYPMLFSIYPILALMAYNLGEFDLSEGWRPLWISLIGCIILWFLLRIIIRDWGKSAVITSMFVGLFYSYGHIYNILKKINIGDFVIGRHRILLPLLLVLLFAGIYWVLKKVKDIKNLGTALNWVTIVLLIVPTYQIILSQMQSRSAETVDYFSNLQISINENDDNQAPDIYYIILDAYTRQDTLQAMYGYDNSEFIESLEDLGFYVAECSQSNYPETFYSLASALNMEYTQIHWRVSQLTKSTSPLKNNNLQKFLKEQGYNIVAFDTGYSPSKLNNVDYYLSFKESSEKGLGNWLAINVIIDFEMLLLETTILRGFEGIDFIDSQYKVTDSRIQRKRNKITYALDQLKFVPNIPSPKFVYAHVISPHLPFFFGPNGEKLIPGNGPQDDLEYAEGYLNQITYLNSQIIPIMESIIRESKTPPIIILQGDHGPNTVYGTSSEYRATILNAYFLPGGGERYLYPDISPVNSFRIILKHYLNANIDLLEDFHYDSLSAKDPDKYPIIQNVGPVCGE